MNDAKEGVIFQPPEPHLCRPPDSIGTRQIIDPGPINLTGDDPLAEPRVLDVPARPRGGTVWQCRCGTTWRCHDLPEFHGLPIEGGRWEWRPETRTQRWWRRRREQRADVSSSSAPS